MNRTYKSIRDLGINRASLAAWARKRETDLAVAVAIHGLADSARTADEIWDNPMPDELDGVEMALRESVLHGDVNYNPDGYRWGSEVVQIGDEPVTTAYLRTNERGERNLRKWLRGVLDEGLDVERYADNRPLAERQFPDDDAAASNSVEVRESHSRDGRWHVYDFLSDELERVILDEDGNQISVEAVE